MTTLDQQPRSLLTRPRPLRPHVLLQRAQPELHASVPLRALEAVHSGAPGPVAVLTDAAVLTVVCVAVLGPAGLVTALVGMAALVVSARVYRDRDRVVARGVSWWATALVPPLAVGTLLDALLVPKQTSATGLAAGSGLAALLAVRVVAWLLLARCRRAGQGVAGALVVGDGDRAATLARTLDRHRDIGLEVVGHVGGRLLEQPEQLCAVATEYGASHVFLVPGSSLLTLPALRRALGAPFHVSYVPLVSDALLSGRSGGRVGGLAVLPLGRPLRGPSPMRGKRVADVVLALLLLTLASPVLLLAALAVRLADRGPALYRQTRTGRDGQPFQITKFRTMREGADAEQLLLTLYNTTDGLLFKMTDDPRVTPVGRLLRRTGLDELPQLLDVLRGTMSLVGPRPLPVENDAFSPRDAERHLVRPGMTGLWQVSGGSTLRYREMVDLDLAYVHGWSPWLDLQIALSTVAVLLRATFGSEGRER